jgi:hypothetical protein
MFQPTLSGKHKTVSQNNETTTRQQRDNLVLRRIAWTNVSLFPYGFPHPRRCHRAKPRPQPTPDPQPRCHLLSAGRGGYGRSPGGATGRSASSRSLSGRSGWLSGGGSVGPLGRSLTIAGSLQVLRLQKHYGKLVPATGWEPGKALDMEIWGVVTPLIRQV